MAPRDTSISCNWHAHVGGVEAWHGAGQDVLDAGRRGLYLPTGEAAGDTFTTWITVLHMAAMWGWPLQLVVCLMGLVITALSVTGVVIWWKKRTARRRHRPARAPLRSAPVVVD